MRDLSQGSRGQDVKQWQDFLITHGLLRAKATGVFASHTDRATRAFQRAQGLDPDGVVGQDTRDRARVLGAQFGSATAKIPATQTISSPAVIAAIEPEPPTDAPVEHDPNDASAPLTESILKQIMPGSSAGNRASYLPFLQQAMAEFEINEPPRIAAFLAQLAHESGQLKFMEEIWGPTADQRKYEPPSRKAQGLGNTEAGDGFRYKGRGPIQLTGRDNYHRFGGALGVDLENNPELAATKEVGFRIAALFWAKNGLNELADAQRFELITKRINGGTKGLERRVKFFERAKQILGVPDSGSFEIGEEEPPQEPPAHFARGLDEPGEITPTAAERNGAPRSTPRTSTSRK